MKHGGKAVYSETEQRVEVMQRQREDERKQFTAEMLRIRGGSMCYT